MKLDTSRQYGAIAGTYEDVPNAHYTQDGKFFDAQMELINAETLHEGQEGHENVERPDDGQRHGHDDADGQENAQSEEPQANDDAGQDEEGHVLEQSDALVMDKTDSELNELAAAGMAALRNYAGQFGVKGVSKGEIIEELKALR